MTLRENAFFKRLVATGEERLTKAATDLLSNEKVMGSLQRAIGAALDAKGLVERNVQTVLSTMNIPTASDVQKLEGKLEELEKVFEALSSKISELQKAEPKGAPGPGPSAQA
jgi:polyhydroxyalkanoate synthesis regulator phasin